MNSATKFSTRLLCLLLLFVTAGCASRPPAGDNSAGGKSAPVAPGGAGGGARAAVISENDKPIDVLTRAMRAQLDAKSYRAQVNTTSDEGSSKMLIEYAAPDRYHMTGETQPSGASQSFKMEYVIAGGATYIKTPNGQWTRSPIDASQMLKAFRDPKMLDELSKSADAKLVGPDTIDGEPMLVYQYTQNNPLGMNLKVNSKTWLSVADGLARKTESEGEMRGKKTRTLITIYDYNTDIKIEAPVK